MNEVHCTGNRDLVQGILRGEWGWEGVLMSDWHATGATTEASSGLYRAAITLRRESAGARRSSYLPVEGHPGDVRPARPPWRH